jgi:carbon storage regulator
VGRPRRRGDDGLSRCSQNVQLGVADCAPSWQPYRLAEDPTPAEKLAFHTNGWRAFAGTLRPPRCVGDAYNMRAKGAVEIGVGANPSGYTHLEGLGQGMLVLSRKRDEKIVIGDEVVITVVEIRGDKVRLGIEAPNHVPVHRAEVHAAIANERKSRAGEV